MTFFVQRGFRVIAHDRRGHGRSDQLSTGNDMEHWVADLAALTNHLDLRKAVHIGHSTGGGEVTRYVAAHQERVAKAVLVASLTPNMVQTQENPAGQPKEWFEAVQKGILTNRAEFYRAVPEGPFYGYNRKGAKPSEAIIANWWRQGMAGSAKAHYETVLTWLEEYTAELEAITVPVLVMHGEDDQIVPFASAVPRAVKHLKKGSLKTYAGYPHGHADHTRGRPQPGPARVHPVLTHLRCLARTTHDVRVVPVAELVFGVQVEVDVLTTFKPFVRQPLLGDGRLASAVWPSRRMLNPLRAHRGAYDVALTSTYDASPTQILAETSRYIERIAPRATKKHNAELAKADSAFLRL